jgi:hypothetical protein
MQDTQPLRQFLLQEALSFVQAATHINGILRIALIGSLTTTKVSPKDVDLLLTIADDTNLKELAAAGRKLKGRTQGRNSGADIFLINAKGKYIGRTCPWRECAPGIRASCLADNCGLQQYLYDDLSAINLQHHLTSAPPIVLWPEVVTHCTVPSDVSAWLASSWQPTRPSAVGDA